MNALILGDALEQLMDYRGKTPKKLGADFTEAGVPVASALLVANGTLNLAEARTVSLETYRSWMKTTTRKGDVLLTSEAPLGRVARVPSDEPLVLGQRLFGLRGKTGVLDNGYLYYALQTAEVQGDLVGRSSGTTVFGIRQSALRQVRIPAPGIEDQRAIAEVLSALDDKIAANIRVTATTAELATSHFSHAYQYADRSFLLSDLVSTQYGITTSAHGEPGPKFLRVTDINKKPWIEWDSTPNCTVSSLELSKYRVSAGDILVARMADPGKAAFIDVGDPEAVFASYLVRLKPHNPAQSLYLYYFLRSPQYLEYAQGAMSGSVQKNMNAKVIVATDVGLPDPNRILQFNETVAPLRKLIQSHLNENRKLAATRDAFLPKLISGELRVKDAEKVLENTGV